MKTYQDIQWSQLDSIGYRQAATLYEFDNSDRKNVLNHVKKYFSVIENTDIIIVFRETNSSVVRFLTKY